VVGLDTWPIGVCVLGEFYAPFVQGAVWVYDQSLPAGGMHAFTISVLGTRDVNGVECTELYVEDDDIGGLCRAYGVTSEANGAFVHATADPDGSNLKLETPPFQWLPANPPQDFVTTSTVFPLNGTYDAHIVSTAATVTVPLDTYTNATHVELTNRDDRTLAVYRMSFWLVPDIGIVRILLEYNTIGSHATTLTTYTLGPAGPPCVVWQYIGNSCGAERPGAGVSGHAPVPNRDILKTAPLYTGAGRSTPPRKNHAAERVSSVRRRTHLPRRQPPSLEPQGRDCRSPVENVRVGCDQRAWEGWGCDTAL